MNLMIRDFGKNSEKKIFVYYIDFTIRNTSYNRHNTILILYNMSSQINRLDIFETFFVLRET